MGHGGAQLFQLPVAVLADEPLHPRPASLDRIELGVELRVQRAQGKWRQRASTATTAAGRKHIAYDEEHGLRHSPAQWTQLCPLELS
eukprot:CAMPEP_0173314492 /NCGR_PEP_ID=MMETSP1143-20121109/25364_1 /TAXON_ID=483371 /ORGANISM="non described non described, Strain CCMP2298" /LENGTH=86 /DNA_ID=CAMNT_0014257097 /DNA_START=215 /DNA_END=475 /DNA_ORIENTATION=-